MKNNANSNAVIQAPDNFMAKESASMAGGLAANFIASGLNVNTLRTNNLLRKEEWVKFDNVVVEIARKRLNGIRDLQTRGLTHDLGGLGTLVSQYEAVSDLTDANINMAGVTSGEEDDVNWDLRSIPVPITHKDFRINIRRLLSSRKLGETVDVTTARIAARKVAEGLEGLLFNGHGMRLSGARIYGYRTHPDRNTGTATGAWSSIDNIYSTILSMIRDANDDNFYGPFIVYVAKDLWPWTLQVYTDGSGQTARERCVEKIPELEDIRHADELADGEIIMVEMTGQTVDLGLAQDVSTVEWNTMGGMIAHFKVMGAMVPRLKSDYDGRMGLVHYTGASASGS